MRDLSRGRLGLAARSAMRKRSGPFCAEGADSKGSPFAHHGRPWCSLPPTPEHDAAGEAVYRLACDPEALQYKALALFVDGSLRAVTCPRCRGTARDVAHDPASDTCRLCQGDRWIWPGPE